MTFFEENLIYILVGMGGFSVLLLIFCIILLVMLNGQKKRYEFFMGSNRRPTHNLEMKLEEYYKTSKKISEDYDKILGMVTDLDENMKSNIQKVGMIRYNPFDEMGGNLCFALALLDAEDNGVVLNGIHSRTGSFTYAKPIQMGVSIYMLSDEEVQAVEMAKNKAYQPKNEKVLKVKFKPTFKRKHDDRSMEEQIRLEIEEEELVDKTATTSLGDVTEVEKEIIKLEEEVAGKIASANVMNASFEEEMADIAEAIAEEECVDAIFEKKLIVAENEDKQDFSETEEVLEEELEDLEQKK